MNPYCILLIIGRHRSLVIMGVNPLCPTEKKEKKVKSKSDGSALLLGVAIRLQTAAALCMAEKADAGATNIDL